MKPTLLRRCCALLLLLSPLIASAQKVADNPLKGEKVLLYTRTKGYRHSSILPGKIAIMGMGYKYGFAVDTSEAGETMNFDNLKQYRIIILHNTTRDFLNDEQQKALEDYVHAGGAIVGIHAAADAEYQWPWYGKMIGGWFSGHPGVPLGTPVPGTEAVPPGPRAGTYTSVLLGKFTVVDKNFPATASMPTTFQKLDEFYDYKNFSPDVHVLVTLDENSYPGGKMGAGDHHPVSWYHEFEGGRVFYTSMGHTDDSFLQPLFMDHLWGGMRWAASGKKINTKAVSSK